MKLTSTQKGGLAELKIAAAAADLEIGVYRPMIEGNRCDLVFEIGDRLLRIQCKWANRRGDVLDVSLMTSRLTPAGYVRTRYNAAEVDGFAAYCRELDSCYFLPIANFEGLSHAYLRLAPARNNQQVGVRMACDYPLGAVAQLGERRHGMPEVRGSSPLSSISPQPQMATFEPSRALASSAPLIRDQQASTRALR